MSELVNQITELGAEREVDLFQLHRWPLAGCGMWLATRPGERRAFVLRRSGVREPVGSRPLGGWMITPETDGRVADTPRVLAARAWMSRAGLSETHLFGTRREALAALNAAEAQESFVNPDRAMGLD